MSNEHEEDLIARWQRGEEAAFAELVLRRQKGIARFLTYYACESGSVEDMCQEVFLRMHLARQSYRSTGAFSTWLYRIALNVARDAARKSKRRSRNLLSLYAPVPTGEPADLVCEKREAQELVAEALAELPEKLRVVVLLRHYEKMSFAEISRLLDTPESTLKSRFLLALDRMRSRLRTLGWSAEDEL